MLTLMKLLERYEIQGVLFFFLIFRAREKKEEGKHKEIKSYSILFNAVFI